MIRLKRFILLFCVAISIPLAYVIWRTYEGLAREEQAQMRFFSETLFDQMEKELAALVLREENRAVDEYQHTLAGGGGAKPQRSPLADPPVEAYILGYLQNNPDGSFQTPLVADTGRVAAGRRELVARLKEVNQIFNHKKFAIPHGPPPPPSAATKPPGKQPAVQEEKKAPLQKEKGIFADRFLSVPKSKDSKVYLGRKTSRVEEITARQAQNLAQDDESLLERQWSAEGRKQDLPPRKPAFSAAESVLSEAREEAQVMQQAEDSTAESSLPAKFQVEVAPFQSVFIHDEQIFIFRRIVINKQIYRQGFVLLVRPFLTRLADTHFAPQPLAGFSQLQLEVMEQGRNNLVHRSGVPAQSPGFQAERNFPAPFDFLSARLSAQAVPASPARGPLNAALAVLGVIMLAGLVAIYKSARTLVDMSERRTQFVSSVTHELKTPLTNIRLYIEMLEQGIAATPEREQEYLRILGSESARLARLINNVLELAKLEKKQRRFQLQVGRLEEVFNEIEAMMTPKVSQEGFQLSLQTPAVPPFAFDREVLIQILINLIENSLKFGKQAAQRHITLKAAAEEAWVSISVVDTGPGIPRHALKKVFDDFYRVDNDLTQATGGTGIGLALVKKFASALGGRVRAANNDGPGCTITLWLPLTSQESGSTQPKAP